MEKEGALPSQQRTLPEEARPCHLCTNVLLGCTGPSSFSRLLTR